MKTTLLFLFTSFLLFQFIEKEKINLRNESVVRSTKLDTLKINLYLNEPIDYYKLKKSKIIEKKSDSNSKIQSTKYIKYDYFCDNKRISEMKGFQHKIDSTWRFGHNGWFMNSFKCESEKMPLKFNLKVGSNIEEFVEFFGEPEVRNFDFIYYDFSRWRAMKRIKIYIKNKEVAKIEITTANNV